MNRRAPGKSRTACARRAKKFRLSQCERCPETKNLHVHHKDRDWSNNNIDNLETLCPTCHLQEHWSEWRIVRGGRAPCRICGAPPDEKSTYKNYCSNHYQMIFKRGRVEPFKRREKAPACIICGGKYFASDLCQRHYHKKRKYGDPLGEPNWEEIKNKMVRKPSPKKPCRICGVEWVKGKSKKDLCGTHRIYEHKKSLPKCKHCERPADSFGLCQAHRRRELKYGDALGGKRELSFKPRTRKK